MGDSNLEIPSELSNRFIGANKVVRDLWGNKDTCLEKQIVNAHGAILIRK